MQIGKLSEPSLRRAVLRQIDTDPKGQAMRYGADCALFEEYSGGQLLFSVVNEVPGFADDPGKLVIAAANNLFAAGAEPVRFLVSAMLPPEYEETRLRADMRRIAETAQELTAQSRKAEAVDRRLASAEAAQASVTETAASILGGHTQISSAVWRPVYSVTGIGHVPDGGCRAAALLAPGQDLVAAGAIALGGTAALARSHGEELGRRYPFSLIDRAKAFEQQMMVGETARAITHFGAAAVHDLSQGGIFNALWEMADRAGVGLEVDLKKIPVRQETIEICEYFDINPYYLYSAGALLVGTEHGEALVSELESRGIASAVIGRVTDGRDRIIRNGQESRFLDRPKQDEWYRRIENERADFNISGEKQQN